MSSTEQAPEPTMDEILASIRRIIADDDPATTSGRAASDEEKSGAEEGGPSAAAAADVIADALESGADSGPTIDDILDLTKVVGAPQAPAAARPEPAARDADAGILAAAAPPHASDLPPRAPAAPSQPPGAAPAAPGRGLDSPATLVDTSPPPPAPETAPAPRASALDTQPASRLDTPPPAAPKSAAALPDLDPAPGVVERSPAPLDAETSELMDLELPKIDVPLAPPPSATDAARPRDVMPAAEAPPRPPADILQADETEDFAARLVADVEAALPKTPALSEATSAADDVMHAVKNIESLAPAETQAPEAGESAEVAGTSVTAAPVPEEAPADEKPALADLLAPQPDARALDFPADVEAQVPERAEKPQPAGAPAPAPVSAEPLPAVSSGDDTGPDRASEASRSLEDSVKDMLRPMLREWLDVNMPRILESAVKDEISGKGGSGRR